MAGEYCAPAVAPVLTMSTTSVDKTAAEAMSLQRRPEEGRKDGVKKEGEGATPGLDPDRLPPRAPP